MTQQKDYCLVHWGREQNVVRPQYVKRITVKFTLDYTAFSWGVTCHGQLPQPFLSDLNCANVAHYSPSSVRPDSNFPNFSAQQSLQWQGETLKSDYYSQVTWDLVVAWLSKRGPRNCSNEGLGLIHLVVFLQMCWLGRGSSRWSLMIWVCVVDAQHKLHLEVVLKFFT